MSKTNGNGQEHTTPEEYLEAAKLAIKLVTEATAGPYRLEDSGKGNGGKYLQRVIRSVKNWRRRPVPGAKTWPEFDDVASIMKSLNSMTETTLDVSDTRQGSRARARVSEYAAHSPPRAAQEAWIVRCSKAPVPTVPKASRP